MHSRWIPFLRRALVLCAASCAGRSYVSCEGGGPRLDGGRPAEVDAAPRPRADAAAAPQDRIFDHRHTDLADVPLSCIEGVKNSAAIFHYAHRSHGSQIIVGAESLELGDPTYGFVDRFCGIPWETGALKMW